MLSKETFLEGMGRLAGNFGREIDGPVQREYYDQLSPHLTDAQFVDAVRRVIGSEKFWPGVAVILEKAGVSPGQQSEGALRVVSDALFKHGGYRTIPLEVAKSWDAATWAGISAIGGLREITCCTEERWPAMQRKFQRAYEAALSPKPILPSMDTRIKALADGIGHGGLPRGDR